MEGSLDCAKCGNPYDLDGRDPAPHGMCWPCSSEEVLALNAKVSALELQIGEVEKVLARWKAGDIGAIDALYGVNRLFCAERPKEGSQMGYPRSIDEFTDLELAQEIEKREKMRAEGKCDYCYQPNTASVCKHSERHLRDVTKPGEQEVDVMTQAAFDRLLEYSCSLPTGQTIGKKWKVDKNFGRRSATVGPDWRTAEYVDDPDPTKIGIKWRRVEILG